VTWSFLFLITLLIGLVMAATSGLMRRMTPHRICHQITVPTPEHRSALVNLIAQRLCLPLVAFGAAGLLLRRAERPTRLATAVLIALGAALVSMLVLRRRRVLPLASRAVVVREIPANGFGQVEVDQGDRRIVLAARSADGSRIPAGSAIEMVDCESSVLTVRPAAAAAGTA
jgi:hypothetical protein